jgi:CDP-diacylglycerol--serine O-phosphatidyltransferase
VRLFLVAVLLFELAPARAVAAAFERSSGAPVHAVFAALPVLPTLPSLPSLPALTVPFSAQAGVAAPAAIQGAVAVAVSPVALLPAAIAAKSDAGRPSAAQGPRAALERLGTTLASPADGAAPKSDPRPALDGAFDGARAEGSEAPAPSGSERSNGSSLAPSSPASAPPPAGPPAPPSGPPRSSRWRAAVPNLITGLNLASGLAAALLASQGALLPAAGLILLANVFDALDGRAARLLGVSSPIGAELDSLADVVSFGVAPALLIYKAALAPLGIWGFAVAAVFAGAGAFRLARFNLGAYLEREGKGPAKKSDSFTGMPIPGGAGVLVALTLLLPAIPAAWAALTAAGVTLLTAAAMASRLPYPAFKKGAKALLAPLVAGAAAAAPLALLGRPLWIPAALFGMYLLTGPAAWIYKGSSDAFKRELKRKAFHQLTLLYIPALLLLGHHAVAAMALWTGLVGVVELIRLRAAWARPFFAKWFGGIIRAKEAERFSGTFYVTLGIAIATALFWSSSPVIVVAAIAALALGDAVSPLVGLRFGWRPYSVMGTARSVDGTLAGFGVAFAIALAAGCGPLAALAAALAFSVVDVIPVKPDDNLWIPVVFAAALHFLR